MSSFEIDPRTLSENPVPRGHHRLRKVLSPGLGCSFLDQSRFSGFQ